MSSLTASLAFLVTSLESALITSATRASQRRCSSSSSVPESACTSRQSFSMSSVIKLEGRRQHTSTIILLSSFSNSGKNCLTCASMYPSTSAMSDWSPVTCRTPQSSTGCTKFLISSRIFFRSRPCKALCSIALARLTLLFKDASKRRALHIVELRMLRMEQAAVAPTSPMPLMSLPTPLIVASLHCLNISFSAASILGGWNASSNLAW
mmetsp:Transcript_58973/g.164806  ORF Transcript_58973/g.164806 Transcript_58973/m.164806 type:complete len:209 (+) Transcript_58973:680-1306(+)